MPRRDRVQISLFPFMSVLACTIGALVVLLAVMSLSAVGSSELSEVAFEAVLGEQTEKQAALAAERERIENAERLWQAVDEALIAQGLTPGLSAIEVTRRVDEVQRSAAVAKKRAALAREQRRLKREQRELTASLAVLESRRETLPILIDPTDLSRQWKPFFVECDEGGATAYRARDDFKYFVPRESIAAHGEFGRYLRRVRAVPGALLVLLVRPDGIATTAETESIARAAGIRVARLPLPGAGELDWSLLRRAEGAG